MAAQAIFDFGEKVGGKLEMFRNRGILAIAVIIAVGVGSVLILRTGCGTHVEMRNVNPFHGIDAAEVEKVKRCIEKAGINGQVVSIQEEDDTYLVLISRTPVTSKIGSSRNQIAPAAPASYRVKKKTGEVTTAM